MKIYPLVRFFVLIFIGVMTVNGQEIRLHKPDDITLRNQLVAASLDELTTNQKEMNKTGIFITATKASLSVKNIRLILLYSFSMSEIGAIQHYIKNPSVTLLSEKEGKISKRTDPDEYLDVHVFIEKWNPPHQIEIGCDTLNRIFFYTFQKINGRWVLTKKVIGII